MSDPIRLYKAIAAHPTYGPGWVDAGMGPPAAFIDWLFDALVTCQTCDGTGKEWYPNGGPHGIGNHGACTNSSCVDGKDYAAALTALGFDREQIVLLADRHPDDPNRIIMNGWLGVTE